MSIQTETLNVGGERVSAAASSAGLVTLYAPDTEALPSAVLLPEHPLAFGREPPPGGLVLPFGSVSRLHARIAARGAELVLDDLDSRNGTFVNGRRVKRAFVEDGDEIRIGEVVFKLVLGDVRPYASWPLTGIAPPAPFDALRGGAAMERVRHEIARTATTDLSVLVLGETGTGKELVADALHRASGRPGRIATVNCAAIPATLLESELFGYKRGAFTGADRDRIGIVKSADGGTLFLDEIGDMPLDAQAKLLRMIETRTVTPLGSHAAEPVDVRIVSATHRPLGRFVREERFRADLFARISGHTIELPPLRERKEDVFQLVQLFLQRARKAGPSPRVTAPFMIGLLEHDWPLNVRELETAIRRAVALADDVLEEAHVPPAAREPRDEPRGGAGSGAGPASTRTTAPSAEDLRALLARHGGNVAAVARELGKERIQIHRWMKRHAISPDEFRT